MINIGGTVYRLHPLFLILMLFSILTGYFIEMLTLFGVVTIHELGHVVAAKSFGLKVRHVQLLPFGGVADIDEPSLVPAPVYQEVVIYISGPLQNGWMAAFSYIMVMVGWGDAAYWSYFLQANIIIGLFNLLPILPLDGGRLLLSFLSCLISYHRALVWTLYSSLLLSAAFILFSLVHFFNGGIQLNLLLVGFFLIYTNWYGYKQLPYQFLRFLIKRERMVIHLEKQGISPVPLMVFSDSQPMEIFRRFRRNQHHILYIMKRPAGTLLNVWPEVRLLRAYLLRIEPPAIGSHMSINSRSSKKIG